MFCSDLKLQRLLKLRIKTQSWVVAFSLNRALHNLFSARKAYLFVVVKSYILSWLQKYNVTKKGGATAKNRHKIWKSGAAALLDYVRKKLVDSYEHIPFAMLLESSDVLLYTFFNSNYQLCISR